MRRSFGSYNPRVLNRLSPELGQKDTRVRVACGSVLNLPVLVLNRVYVPIRVTTVRRALCLLFSGSAWALDDLGESYDFTHWRRVAIRPSDDHVALVDGRLRAPRVLNLVGYDRVPRIVIRLSRQNLMLRDQYQCQYCGRHPGPSDLNVDHVVPRSRGGRDTWENLVISCRSCNLRKGKRTPREAGMRLLQVPSAPRLSYTAMLLQGLTPPFVEWGPFLETG